MLFNNTTPSGYFPFSFDKRFLIFRYSSGGFLELCMPNDHDEYPPVVKRIIHGVSAVAGKMADAHNLAWEINKEYRGQGLMTKLLEYYLQEATPNGSYFAAVILKDNLASIRIAQKVGFTVYDEDDNKLYFKK